MKAYTITPAQEEARLALDKLADSLEFSRAYWGGQHHEEHERAVTTWTTLWHQAFGPGVQVNDPPTVAQVIDEGHFQLTT